MEQNDKIDKIDKIMKKYKLFWQYPVITEQTFYNQSKGLKNYLGFPWATILDKRYHPRVIFNILSREINVNKAYITCCQHIYFRILIPLFKALGVRVLYTPHKVIGEDRIHDIQIKPCPLYAVNIENPERNKIFIGKDLMKLERKYLYSFQGAWDGLYISDIRKRIFGIKSSNNIFIKYIGRWHFNELVYSPNQNANKNVSVVSPGHNKDKKDYNELLLASRYSLCPSGSGPNSIRLWESLAVGTIPIILADTLELPEHKYWDKAVLRVKEKDLGKLDEILSKIDSVEETRMRSYCLKIYAHFRSNFINL
mgnify:CR=1 FL=1